MQTHNCMVKEDEFQERLKSYSVYLKRNLLLKVDLQLMLMTNKNVQRLEDKIYENNLLTRSIHIFWI